MFTKLAKYLLGTEKSTPEQVVVCDVRLREVSADDGWVLIDSTNDKDEDISNGDLQVSIFNLPPIPEPLAKDYYSPITHTSLECTSLEESWFLTPPPCFMTEGPIYMETSPLENLLIEHPSMSVYQHSLSTHLQLHPVCVRKSWNTVRESSKENDADVPKMKTTVLRPSKHVNGIPNQQEKEYIQMIYAQKIRQCGVNQVLKRTNMDRSNKAREISSSKKKRQRRSDKQNHHSGANNNRKCCT